MTVRELLVLVESHIPEIATVLAVFVFGLLVGDLWITLSARKKPKSEDKRRKP